ALHDSWDLKEPIEPGKFLLLFGVMPVFLLLVILSLFASLLRACGQERVSQLVTRRFLVVLAWTILALAGVWCIMAKWSLAERIASVDRLYVERAINFSDGVSPLVPAVLLAAAISCWCFSQLSRL